eukprot:6183680-Pleurochrysis_carterae.AAC.1
MHSVAVHFLDIPAQLRACSNVAARACTGALVWCYDLVHTPTGAITSASLALFHGAAVCAFMVAWAQRAISAKKVLMPHAPCAILFAWHAYSRFTGPKGALR